MVCLDKSKKVQVVLDIGIYEIIQDLKESVYRGSSDSKICASIIESFLNEHDYTRKRFK